MKENQLDQIKAEYLGIKTPKKLEVQGWDNVSVRLKSKSLMSSWSKGFVFLSIALLVISGGLFGLYQISLASIPGNPLYPVKILGEKVIEKTTGNNQVVINHRADEIVNLAQQKESDTQKLETSVIEYKKVVTQTQEKVTSSNNEEEAKTLQENLEKHNEKFHKVIEENPGAEKELEDAINVSEHQNNLQDNEEGHGD